MMFICKQDLIDTMLNCVVNIVCFVNGGRLQQDGYQVVYICGV